MDPLEYILMFGVAAVFVALLGYIILQLEEIIRLLRRK